MINISNMMDTMLWNLLHRHDLSDIADILLVAIVIYELFKLVRQTRGSAVLKGVALFLVATLVSELVGLTALNWTLMTVLKNGALVLIILFQPELRKALEEMGRGALFTTHRRNTVDDAQRIVNEIVLMAEHLSRRKVGALVVFERKTGLRDVIETGTAVDSRISAPLLENIFEPNTPLHDGAVVVRADRIVAAACILPLTEDRDVNRELGTRHRAAIGVSENSDAIALVVSEETGAISITKNGQIKRHLTSSDLREFLTDLYAHKEQHWSTVLRSKLLKGGRAHE